MACDAECAECVRKLVEEGEEDEEDDDSVNEAGERFLGEDGMFFHQFREVVKSGCNGEGEEEEGEEEAKIAENGKNPHFWGRRGT